MGCGYEPRSELVQIRPWQPPAGKAGYQGGDLTVCAGYTTSLPEVRETTLARVHWDTGNIIAFCGEMPTEDLLNAIVILVGASNDVQRWCMTPANEGGGGA